MTSEANTLNNDELIEGYEVILHKERPTDRTTWVTIVGRETAIAFTFDKKKLYFLYRDYHLLSPEEKEIFDKENPYWANYFK